MDFPDRYTHWKCLSCGNEKWYRDERAMVICPACMNEMIEIKEGEDDGSE